MKEAKDKEIKDTIISPEVDKMVETVAKSELDKIVGVYKVKPVRETWLTNMAHLKDKHNMYPGDIFNMYVAERDEQTGLIITGLTKDQQKEFEEEMNLKPGDLSPYNTAYWRKHFIKIPENGLILDCNKNVKDKLNYMLLRVNTKVAQSMADLPFKINAELVITSEEVEREAESKEVSIKEKAYAKLATMSLVERLDFLKVFDEGSAGLTKSAKPEAIQSAIGRIVDTKSADFLSTFDNPYYKEAIFLKDCLNIRAVTKQGQKYYITGGEKIGDSYIQTLMNLQSPDWNEAKISLLGKLQASK